MLTTALALALTLSPAAPQAGAGREQKQPTPWELLSSKYDADGDGKVSPAEYPRGAERFARLDSDGDGVLTARDLERLGDRGLPRSGGVTPRVPRVPGERPAPPETGEPAPGFELPVLHWGDAASEHDAMPESVSLASYAGKKPVALIFGSYT